MDNQLTYQEFIGTRFKRQGPAGFDPVWLPDFLFDFQKHLVEWALRQGRCALFEECGLGKSPQELVWAENVVRYTNGNVLLLTPLAVAPQMLREAEKFGIEAKRTKNGEVHRGINVVNYHRLEKYNPDDFVGVVADESSVIKHEDSATRKLITKFLSKIPYRLLATATPAPNDFMELGTSCEALGVMKRDQMLAMFFTNDGEKTQQWNLKGHARRKFWEWVGMWARAVRKPSDIGFDDERFLLPPLNMHQCRIGEGGLFITPAATLNEQRKEKRGSLSERCAAVVDRLPKNKPGLVWCQLNDEGDELARSIPGAVQVAGNDSDEKKEERLSAFSTGQIRVLVTKPSIACFGLNWQHCSNVSYFPSHSHEQFYQAIRRCWRFGQTEPVDLFLIYTAKEQRVVSNMLRKERASNDLYDGIVRGMGAVQNKSEHQDDRSYEVGVPLWLK